ncbi:MAG: conserved rane protein of unknown function [Modestobacter sp.]|jgi:hypothetical protein|nr:conserved rane protein of unknown function [Modestobacter sp.]
MSRPAGGSLSGRSPLYQRRPLLAGLVRQWPLFLVIVAVGAGLVLVAVQQWRRGLVVIGLALVLAALLRLLLPLPRLGFLAVRSRPLDVGLCAVAGVTVAVLALTIPHA